MREKLPYALIITQFLASSSVLACGTRRPNNLVLQDCKFRPSPCRKFCAIFLLFILRLSYIAELPENF
jgi:hypothetical protein